MNHPIPIACHLVHSLEIEQSPAALGHLRAAALPGNWSPAGYVARLVDHQQYRDARHFLAHALAPRRALWWACLCARDVREFVAEGALDSVIEIASRFVRWPTESLRRQAEAAMNAQPLQSFTAHLAAAVFLSSGSLAPRQAQAIAVPPQLLGRLVSTVVYAAATKKNVVRYVHHMREYIELGREIAQGRHLWPRPAEKVHRVDGDHCGDWRGPTKQEFATALGRPFPQPELFPQITSSRARPL